MAGNNNTTCHKKLLFNFMSEPYPLNARLQWLTEKMMAVEAEAEMGATKGAHSKKRITYFTGTRGHRFDTRLGTMYLLVMKLR